MARRSLMYASMIVASASFACANASGTSAPKVCAPGKSTKLTSRRPPRPRRLREVACHHQFRNSRSSEECGSPSCGTRRRVCQADRPALRASSSGANPRRSASSSGFLACASGSSKATFMPDCSASHAVEQLSGAEQRPGCLTNLGPGLHMAPSAEGREEPIEVSIARDQRKAVFTARRRQQSVICQ
jgi:hypothetical protein